MIASSWLPVARAGVSLFYGVAGCAHLVAPEPFIRIVPPMAPWPEAVVALTGIAEIAGAIALQVPRLRKAAGAMLALYALAVWPANIWHAVAGIEIGALPTSWWYHAPRLAFQPVLIWLPLWVSGLLPQSAKARTSTR